MVVTRNLILPKICGAAAAATGLVVLAGWWLHVPALTSLHPGLVSMKPNTALSLVLAGAALVVLADTPLSPRRVRLGRWLALLVLLIGALTLCEYLFGWQLGIDELLFREAPGAVATLIPGRMAPSTAACFVLLGLALVGLEWEPRRGCRPAELLAFAGEVVSLISLAEYAAGRPILYDFSAYTRMAPHTGAALAVLFAGVLMTRPALGVVGTVRSGRITRVEIGIYSAAAATVLAVLIGGAAFYRTQEQRARQEVEAELSVIARLKVEQIGQWRVERVGDASVLSAGSIFSEVARRWFSDPQAKLAEDILSRLRAMQRYNKYSDVQLVDDRTHVRLSLSGRKALDPEEVLLLAAVRQAKQPMLSDLHNGSGTRPPHLDLIAPLFAGAGANRQFMGSVVLTIDAGNYLYPLIRTWPTTSPSAENLLVRRDGNAVLFLNDLRHSHVAAFSLRIPLSQREVPAVAAVLGREGVFRGLDYRGVPVLSVLSRIPDTSWFMVSKVDEVEAMAAWHFRAKSIIAVILSMMLALVGATGAFWQQRRRYRTLHGASVALRQSNRAYRVLSKCNEALVRATDEAQLLQSICELLVEHGGYRFAWVGFAERDEARSVRPVANAGHGEGYLEQARITWADTERGRGPTGTAIRTGNVCVAHDVATDPTCAPWRDAALARGYASAIVLPLPFNGDIGGALCIYHSEVNAFDPEETQLLAELAADLAYGIRALRSRKAHRQAEEALALERNKLAAAFENVDVGVVVCDARGGGISMNATALKFHGFASADDMVARIDDYAADWELRYPDGRVMPYDEWPLVRAIRCDYVRNCDSHLRNIRTCHTRACSYSSAPVHNSAGDVDLIVMTLLDITERNRAAQEILALNASLEQRVAERTRQLVAASQAKSDFLANMSHELRTPLNAIIGFSEMLKDGLVGNLDSRSREYVTDIYGAGTHLLSLINDILDLSKVEAGMMRLEPEVVDVAALLHGSTLIIREKAAAHQVRLETDIAPALGPILLDARKVKQIVYNLLANAVRFTPEGGTVTLGARRCTRADIVEVGPMPARVLPLPGRDDEFLELWVSDTGVGIAEEDLQRLFESFTQVDSSAARRQGGTGLGLAMVKCLAVLHGGTVGVASRPDVGSRFSVWLPCRTGAAAGPVEPATAAGEAEGGIPATAPSPEPRAIPLALVIEDDDAVADMISTQLRADGFSVMRAATGEEGLVRAAKQPPSLITLDILLPAMDGWEFLRRLKMNPALADIPVTIISVSADAEHGLALGARRVLLKPFTRDALAETLAGLVEPRAHGGEQHRVLVVDDNPKAVDLIATALESEGYRVMRAYSGTEAMEVARRSPPDLVVLDLLMPEMSGFEVARTLRASDATNTVPIIVITAKDLTAEDHARLNGDVTAVLAKSNFSRRELLVELRRALASHATS